MPALRNRVTVLARGSFVVLARGPFVSGTTRAGTLRRTAFAIHPPPPSNSSALRTENSSESGPEKSVAWRARRPPPTRVMSGTPNGEAKENEARRVQQEGYVEDVLPGLPKLVLAIPTAFS